MGIENFPVQLQAAIQQGFLAREFENGLRSRLGFRQVADREVFPNAIGETLTKTRKSLKAPVTTPMLLSGNTNFDNGLSPSGWSVEQYTLSINQYGDTIDLNMVTSGVGIASQFLANASTNGIQAMQSLDRLARNTLFGGAANGVGGYLGGNTRVTATLGSAGSAVSVDDVRGFQNVIENGQVRGVGASAGMTVTVGSGVYTLVAVVADATNVSTAPGGVSGQLTFDGSVSVSDGTEGNAVVAATAPLVLRPNGRLTTAALQTASAAGAADTLGIQNVLAGVAALRRNNVPMIDGAYHCYLDDLQLLSLFRDADFKYLYRGAYGSEEYRSGQVIELLGVRFIPTTEAPQQASLGAGTIHRALLLGQGALIEGDCACVGHSDIPDADRALIEMVDGVAMVTREPLDRLRQIIAQSWYWIGGFALPTDVTADAAIIPTATNAYLKRGVVIESLGTDALGLVN
ncbi:hypothetical protein AA101099_1519 [Neoasaia chiangmaiensis NBRC 101099]|uniref:Uncharacterized protein n=1 Tax=Neoasaia chiangmaiensis TaxID=320497 RepID=A0A1U9KQ50_9PROT|nr:DUF4043 domain-containing protein [Neoasaia chiangmaiensis]AQS87916.1 hypothetical protein A0U93_08140 [Neoasaia chiangmaiensis]GBR39107.1 hypothetical protein AA101099_1519 [Neoasaia chiangmaiensis NBRC 101099]GEN15563.1 hypothetical protein NCH01_19940 [Neoasaia chiangmaiensis]